jgi:hypothetical protein
MDKPIEVHKLSETSDELAKIELQNLANQHLDPLALDARLHELHCKTKIGKRILKQQLQRITTEIKAQQEAARRDSTPPPPGPSEEELAKQQAAERDQQELDEAIAKRATEISNSTNVLQTFCQTLTNQGYIATLNMAGSIAVSHGALLLPRCAGFFIGGSSASGKSDLVQKAAIFLPPEVILEATSLSEKAIWYLGDVAGKYIIGGELRILKPGEDDPWQQAMRQLITEGHITRLVPEKRDDGSISLVKYEVNGPAVLVVTSTQDPNSFNDEFINRLSVMQTDETPEITRAVMEEQARRKKSPPTDQDIRQTQIEIEAWRYYHRQLKRLDVFIPFAEQIIPQSDETTMRRLNVLIHSYISVITLLHQAKRTIDGSSIYSTLQDYRMAYPLISANLPKVSDTVNPVARATYERLKSQYGCGEYAKEFTQAQARTDLKLSDQQMKNHCRTLTKAGCLSCNEQKGTAWTYKVLSEPPASHDFRLVHPDSIGGTVGQPGQNAIVPPNFAPGNDFGGSGQRDNQNGQAKEFIF